MAKLFGKNSGYLQKNDIKYFFFAAGIPVFLLGIYWIILKVSLPGTALLAAMIVLIIIVKLADPFVDFFKRKSLKFYRGWGGELEIKKELEKLPEDFSVFQDITIGQGKGNIDFVVVGPTGIFTVEVKSHRGFVDFDGYKLVINGRIGEKDFLRQAKGQSFALKEYLQPKIGQNIYVKPVLAFSNRFASMRFGHRPVNGVFVVQKNFLSDIFFTSPETINELLQNKIETALKSIVL